MSIYGINNGVFSGLGKPTIKLEFEDNNALLDFQKRMTEQGGTAHPVEYKDGEFYPLEGVEVKEKLNYYAEPFRTVDLNIWRINNDFQDVIKDKNGTFVFIVKTPLKYIFLRDSQFKKLIDKKRKNYFGLIKPTLTDPVLIVEDNGADIYIKSFFNSKGERILCFCSVCDNTDDFVRSNHEKRENQILDKIKADSVKYLKGDSHVDYGINGTTHAKSLLIVDFPLFDCKNDVNFSDNQIFDEKNFNSLNAPGDTYIITDTRKKPRKELDQTAAFKKFDIEKFTNSGSGWDEVKLIDINTISKDTARFQNREGAENSESVNRIIKDVYGGKFDWAKFDPIIVWYDDKQKKLFVLSGHSRTKAFEELSKNGAMVDGKTFTKIPAKFFKGTESEAIEFALNSNTLSTKETDIERANYYRRKRESGRTSAAELIEEIKNNEGKNWVRIWAFSNLKENGFTNSALKALQNSSNENAEIVRVVAEWIGKIFAKYPFLTYEHDKEIYNYLINEGAYGKGPGKVNNYQKLLEKVTKAIDRRTQWGKFDDKARLNLLNLNESTNNLRAFDDKKAALNAELKAAKKELDEKRKIFIARQKVDKSITNEQINNALKPYADNVNLLQRRLIELESNKSQYTDADRRQQALTFEGGLGKMANPLIYNNLEILECRGMKPTYTILDSYDNFFKPASLKNTFSGFGLDDTKKLIADTCRKYWKDCKAIAAHLKDKDKLQSAFNLWHWLHHNIRYEYDKEGREEIRSPLRVWADRFRGVDCDCLSVFAWCVLKCMGYNPVFELAAFRGRPQFSHIYINLDGIVIDRVWFIFNSRPPLITKTELYKVELLNNLGQLF